MALVRYHDFLRVALDRAKSYGTSNGNPDSNITEREFGREKLDALKRLIKFARSVESRLEPLADFDGVIRNEQAISKSLDGRTVLDDKRDSRFYVGRSGQRSLF